MIFEDAVLDTLVKDPRETLALVDKYEGWMDGTVVKIGEDDSIKEFVPGKKFRFEDIPFYYKTVNIYKFSRHFSKTHYVPFLEAYSMALGNNEYYEQVLRVITMLDEPEIKAKRLDGQLWYEIDDIQDLDIASSMFVPDEEEKLKLLQVRYGGYWRYPKLKDFCYLVNPYFPPQKLIDEIKANTEKILTQYPSGASVNSLLAAKNFGVHQEHIVVGNGAAELIKDVLSLFSGNIGFIRPTFEEYPNRCQPDKCIVYIPDPVDFTYNSSDLITFFDSKNLQMLVLINPDNPSGNYINKSELLKLCNWTGQKDIRLLIDESFCDFAEEQDNTLITEEILREYPHLLVVKSISKSYGIPGARLGILASGDEEFIRTIKNGLTIWNINSFGEFYMQIAEKYKSSYKLALDKFKDERKYLWDALREIHDICVFPSQANFFMIELKGDMTSAKLAIILLIKYDIFIKDLSNKIHCDGRQFIRVSIRNHEDNEAFIQALRQVMDHE